MAWPVGNVTFLFTDIEGSTRLLGRVGERYADLLEEHRGILRDACGRRGGTEVGTEGDGMFFSFGQPAEAVAAAVEAQIALGANPWPPNSEIRVRIGIHTGQATIAADGYVGLAVHAAARISAAGHGGQIVVSASTVDPLDEAGGLPGVSFKALGQHKLKDLDRGEWLFQVCHRDLPVAFAPLRTLAPVASNLPPERTSFVGREKMIADLDASLRKGTRLLSLVGPGGSGKTRIGIHLAGASAHRYPDGVWLAELASIAAEGPVDHILASALGIQEEPGRRILDTIAVRLQPAHLLLVLDNCEHVLDRSAAVVEALLDSCPNLQVVTTSREALRVQGEMVWPVGPLKLPDALGTAMPPAIRSSEAVRLFLERAHSARPDFVPDDAQIRTIGTICRRLDGIPLAIELAAAKMSVLGISEVYERLDDRFRLLTGGVRAALPRQQTLRALVDWSYELLDRDEQVLLRRLSVFVGGHTLEMADAVAGFPPLPLGDVVEVQSRLVAKSLLTMDTSGTHTRYALLETIRQYAAEKLDESGEQSELVARHRRAWAEFAERVERHHMSAAGPAWHDRVELDMPNIRTALESAFTTRGAAGDALHICGQLGLFFWLRGHTKEGRSWTERALAADDGSAPVDRARALLTRGILAFTDLEVETAATALRESVELAESHGEELLAGWAMTFLGLALSTRGDVVEGGRYLDRALEIARRHASGPMMAGLHYVIGSVCAVQGDTVGAAKQLQAALAMARAEPAPYVLVRVLPLVAAEVAVHDAAAARSLFSEALEVARATHDQVGVARALLFLSEADITRGDLRSARANLGDAVPVIDREIDDVGLSVRVQLALARVDRIAGRFSDARDRLTQAMAAAERLGQARKLVDVHHAYAALAFVCGDWDAAEADVRYAMRLARELQLTSRVARELVLVAHVALERGNLDLAQSLLAESRAARIEHGEPSSHLVANLHAEGRLELARRRLGPADALLRQALTARATAGYRIAATESMEALAAVCAAGADSDKAALLLGAADLLRSEVGAPVPPAWAAAHQDLTDGLRDRTGAMFAELWARGRDAGICVASRLG